AAWDKVVPHPCPSCGANYLVEKVTKREGTVWKCANAECGYKAPAPAASETPAAAPPATAPHIA
ncbi:MAG TPA: hypothetical protein VNF27_07340, partial [Candidatus Binataceae bacterium]|nr:hypothetical protein [Candidatus Binataceae bacterium]